MTIYYKATRPDGTDFYTSSVDYAGYLVSGEPLPLLTSLDGVYACCTDTVYHASDTPSETLIGGIWPCRLFEVTGEPVDQKGHKFGFRTMRVIREIDAWQALGPNGAEVAELIEAAGRLTVEQVLLARCVAWDAARDAAWYAARDAAWRAARVAARDAAFDAARDAAWHAARVAARYAAMDAAGALVVRDLISVDKFDTLYGPWKSMIDSEGK